MMMSTLGYFFPTFLPGNTLPCVIVASLFMWALTFLVHLICLSLALRRIYRREGMLHTHHHLTHAHRD